MCELTLKMDKTSASNSVMILFVLSIVEIASSIPISNRLGISRRMVGLTYTSCSDECWLRRECLSISYSRYYSVCELYSIRMAERRVPEQEPAARRINVDVERDWETQIYLEKYCKDCPDIYDCVLRDTTTLGMCEVKPCDPPRHVVGALTLGNNLTVGSKVMYKCREPFEGKYERIRCTENSNWTTTNISCTNCVEPHVTDGTVHMSWYNDTHIAGNVTCHQGYTYRGLQTLGCESITGEWDETLTYACCDRNDPDPWRLVFRMNGGYEDEFIKGFRYGTGYVNQSYQYDCQYRDDDIMSNWNTTEIHRVKLQLVKDGEVKAFLIFDGTDTDEKSWFATRNLLNSSWKDLMDMKHSDFPLHISFFGIAINFGRLRFLVSMPAIDNPANCNLEFGWMFMTKEENLPCLSTSIQKDDRLKIVFSNNDYGTQFSPGSGFDFADKMEIYVELASPNDQAGIQTLS